MLANQKLASKLNLSIAVAFFEDDGTWLAYCPALDISTYGDSEDDVRQAFDEAIEIFIEDVMSRGTLESYLRSRGWTIQKQGYKPPAPSLSFEMLEQLKHYSIRDSREKVYSIPA